MYWFCNILVVVDLRDGSYCSNLDRSVYRKMIRMFRSDIRQAFGMATTTDGSRKRNIIAFTVQNTRNNFR
jgi:hypothetical protein